MLYPEQPSSVPFQQWIVNEVTPHESALRRYLNRRFPSIEADDVVQETYLKLLRTENAGQVASAKAYFFTIARNTALTVFRRGRFLAPAAANDSPGGDVADVAPDAAEMANTGQRRDLALAAIQQLPGRCRQIVTLAAFHRMAPREIAEQLGLAESTVHVQMARGVRKCADYLREQGD